MNSASDHGYTQTVTAEITLNNYINFAPPKTFQISLICLSTLQITSVPTPVTYNIEQGLLLTSQIVATQTPACLHTQTFRYEIW